jgi:hypothetical protein
MRFQLRSHALPKHVKFLTPAVISGKFSHKMAISFLPLPSAPSYRDLPFASPPLNGTFQKLAGNALALGPCGCGLQKAFIVIDEISKFHFLKKT